ncbi:flagellar hook assembly protein FlgD [Peredibacter sp. HCB2-198]|uniref:flagellar hook assembly protein FlgD n=1 Tax=Peredibacter sp. HCB2-198 TaxID=3383025 RepID=UPI0038B5AE1D
MPEIGRPVTPQQMQYQQVTMGPKSLGGQKSEKQIREDIINKATGYKPKNELFKEGPHNQMGKDEFMKLLTFQLQNQDPMNPMDQSKFTGELAQFSQLEQLTNLNKKFDEGNKNQGIQDKFYAASFIGKKVVTNGSSINLKNSGDPGDVLFKLDGDSAKVMVRILDEKNNVMGEIWKDGMSSGSHQVTWDGVALDGSPAVKGTYRAQVKAWDHMGNEVGTRTEATGTVQSVTFDEGEPVLTVNGQKVFLRDVKSFHTAETQTHFSNSNAEQATNSGLSGQDGSIQFNNNAFGAKSVPTQQAMNAYEENTGIYD